MCVNITDPDHVLDGYSQSSIVLFHLNLMRESTGLESATQEDVDINLVFMESFNVTH